MSRVLVVVVALYRTYLEFKTWIVTLLQQSLFVIIACAAKHCYMYILLQHLHIYFSSEDEVLFPRFKSEMDRLKVMLFCLLVL